MKILIIFICLVTNYINASPSSHQHPHGSSQSIYDMKLVNGKPVVTIEFEKFDKMLNHPDVRDRKIVVFSILGALRKGKSFFFDYCLRYLYANYESINTKGFFRNKEDWMGSENEPLKGFSWRGGSEATTRGIIFWNDVFLADHNDEKLAIVIIDTQGLFEMGSSVQSDTRIFGLTTMFSSIQVINLMGVVQEDQLQYLEMATDFTQIVTAKQQNKKIKSSSKPFQNFIFLFRDWVDDNVGYGYEGGLKYLTTIFSVASDNQKAQKVRDNINSAFDNIYCFLMPHPGKKVTKNNFNGAWKSIDEDFVENLKNLIVSIFAPENLVKKKIFNQEVTASEFSEYAITFLRAYDSEDLPQIDSIYSSASEKQIIMLVHQFSDFYQKKMNDRIDYDRNDFEEALVDDHESIKDETVSNFLSTPKMGDDEMEQTYKEALESEIDKFYGTWNETVLHTYSLFKENKINAENARKQSEEDARKLIDLQWHYAKAMEEKAHRDEKERKKNRRNYIACKIFTLGIHRCK